MIQTLNKSPLTKEMFGIFTQIFKYKRENEDNRR